MKFLSKKAIIFYVLIIAAVGAFALFVSGGNQPTITTETVTRGTLLQQVSVNGTVDPAENINLAFNASGIVTSVNKKEGDHVSKGEVIMSLDTSALRAQLAKAQANVAAQQAALDKLTAGTRPEEIAVTKAELAQSEQSLANYYDDIPSLLTDAVVNADDALYKRTDSLFSGSGQSASQSLTFSTSNQQLEINVENERIDAFTALGGLQTISNTLPDTNEGKEGAVTNAITELRVIQNFLADTYTVLGNAVNLTDTTKASYQADVTTARDNISSSISSLSDELQSIASTKADIVTAQNKLTLEEAGSTKEDIDQQRAVLEQAQADVANIEAQIEEHILRSPIDGVITAINTDPGEVATTGASAASVISDGNFEIKADVPEVDVTKLSIGDTATATLDAYGSDVYFHATVARINPGATVIEGVPTYQTTFLFTDTPKPLKAGMSADVTVDTARRDNVISIPGRAISTEGNKTYVQIVESDGTMKKAEVTTGLHGIDGLVEITGGLTAGETVVTFIQQ